MVECSSNEEIIEVVIENCLVSMEKFLSPERSAKILKKILKDLTKDYPYLETVIID